MNKKISYILGLLVIIAGVGTNVFAGNTVAEKISAVTSAPPAQTEPVTKDQVQQPQVTPAATVPVQIHYTNPIVIVNKPSAFLNKKVDMVARFDKFATLGLDYKPAMRSSETYISFLIFRPDTDKNIPLSEMKLFIPRKSAEKLIDLKENDQVKISGTVFSNALGDVWIDVENLSKLNIGNKK